MASKNGAGVVHGREAGGGTQEPRSVEIASGGISDTRALTRFGSALIGDIMTGAVSPKIANPVCRTGGMMLRATEMEQRHNDGKAIPLG